MLEEPYMAFTEEVAVWRKLAVRNPKLASAVSLCIGRSPTSLPEVKKLAI
jgi:hypothetical protein